MADIHLTWTDTGVQRRLTHLKAALDDTEPVWKEYAQWLRIEMREQFDTEGIHLGHNPWKPLSEKYKKQKDKRFPGAKILEATKTLLKSLTEPGGKNIARWTRDTFEFGTEVDYFKYHQTGTRRMPARPPFDDFTRLAAGLGRIWQRHMMGEASPIGDESASSEASEV